MNKNMNNNMNNAGRLCPSHRQQGADPGDFRRGARGTQDEWDRARDDAFVPRAG
jgi:hypothetical protein